MAVEEIFSVEAGLTTSTDFPTTSGAYQTTYGGVDDAFVTKFSFPTPVAAPVPATGKMALATLALLLAGAGLWLVRRGKL